jgi:type I restriction enzyme S subunit
MGKIARLPSDVPIGVINQALMRVRLNEDIVRHDYFLEFFRSTLFQRKILKDSRGSGMQNMAGIKEIKPIKIKLPPLEEQKQIVQEIESRLSSYDKVEQSIKESLEKSEALRQSILKKAFDGDLLSELEVEQCKQEKDYEPANVLLERIKSEKIAKEKTDKKAKIKKKTKK